MIKDSVGKKVTPELITQLYQEELGRSPEEGAVRFYQDLYGDTFDQRELDQFRGSKEAKTFESEEEKEAGVGPAGILNLVKNLKKEEPVAPVIPASQIIDLYQTELGRDPNAEEIKYYQDYYGSRGTAGIDPFEVRQFQSTPEAVTYRQGFDRAFPKLYEEIFRVGPTAQQTAEARERFGDLITPDEVNRFIRDPQTISQVQSGIRSTLGIPAVTQSGTGPIDFSKFGAAPITTGPTATAGIERLQPRETVGGIDRLIGGTMASTFANPEFTSPFSIQTEQQKLPDTFTQLGDLFGEQFKADLRAEAAAEEAEGKRAGGLASLGYRRGGRVTDDVMRFGLGGFIKKLYKGVKNVVNPIYRAVKPYIPYVLPPQIGIPLAAADAGIKDGNIDLKKAAMAAGKVYAANKIQDALAGTDSFAQFNEPVALDPSKAGPTQPFPQIAKDPSTFESIKQFGSKVGESFDPRNISLQGMQSGAEFGIGRAADALSLKGGEGAITKAAPGAVGLSTIKGAEIAEEQMKEQKARRDAILGAQERERKKYRDLAARLGQQFPFQYNEGGISSLPARYLDGAGDGMSDSIKANIGGMQEARLADGEFVVPADVVADLGNGSSNAGAERLYSMMDRIRQARHGTTKQPPEVNVNKALPA